MSPGQALAMPQPSRNNRMLLVVFGTGAAIGLQAGLAYLLVWRSPLALLASVLISLAYAAATYVLWRWVFALVRVRSFAIEVAVQTLLCLVAFIVLAFTFSAFVLTSLGAPPPPVDPQGFGPVSSWWIRHALPVRLFPILPIVLICLIGYHQTWKRIANLEDRQRELTELAATAQLAALRAQLSPHFLFNSLNSIAQLIHVDPDRAEACVQKLAAIFRYVLRRSHQDLVPFAEELEVAEAYLDIERARFGDRLRVITAVDPQSLRQLIPNLILQPLVENAVKHGLATKVGPGTVRIDARIEGSVLQVTVGDDGRGMPAPALAQVWDRGVGLSNLRARLERLYGPEHLPEITSTPGGGTKVCLRLPVRPAEAA